MIQSISMNRSPWIAQLNRTREATPIDNNHKSNILIIGGGIAGVTTAYSILKKTNHTVMLLEGGKIAHGATGHNAGQISSDFEVSFTELVERFGAVLARDAQQAIDVEARQLLRNIITETGIAVPYIECTGYFGIQTIDAVMTDLSDMRSKKDAGLRSEKMYIDRNLFEQGAISAEYLEFCEPVDRERIQELLETTDTKYIAVDTFPSGVMNSALFTEELFKYVQTKFADRFVAREHSFVSKLTLTGEKVYAYSGEYVVEASSVVLCTNGFESISIQNDKEELIDKTFHEEIYGIVGYMTAYVQSGEVVPGVIAYGLDYSTENNPYYYVTRRNISVQEETIAGLISFGGPQMFLPERATYNRAAPYPQTVIDDVDTFASHTYHRHPDEMEYRWHGLMGYTKSKVRLIGPDKHDTKLLYNLGCNGIGILTSVYGAERIGLFLQGEKLQQSIFDVQL